jgi:phosphonate transport system ATP-binding protein
VAGARVDLADAVRQKAGTLSGGQQQRVSVARALYNGRPIVLGDEPVSALDARQGARVLETIHAVHATSILALHDVALALDHASRVVVLKDGRVALDAPAAGLRAADLVALYQA